MYYIDYKDKKYPARDIDNVPDFEEEGTVTVADYSLWLAIENDYNKDESEAIDLDAHVFVYVKPGYLETNPSDDELRNYLSEIL